MGDLPYIPDLGRRIRAARAHAGISRDTLAESLSFPLARLERLEAGLDAPSDDRMGAVIKEIAEATRLPEQFFIEDWGAMKWEIPPGEKLSRLEQKLDDTVELINSVLEDAMVQVGRVAERLDEEIEQHKDSGTTQEGEA
jgi:transcriptional regulator with XRE-family HTH domain